MREELLADREIVFAKPRLADWRTTWTSHERAATERFVHALVKDMAEREYDAERVDTWVCALGRLLDDARTYLAPLLADTPAAAANLLGLYEHNEAELARGELSNAFWEDAPAARRALVEWFRRPDVRTALDRARSSRPLEDRERSN